MPSDTPDARCDVLVIGAGMAGASAGAELARANDVLVVEAESQPGYHTTGRSAAFFAESYGGAAIRPLTSASKAFFLDPPDGFCEAPLVTGRGAFHVIPPDAWTRGERVAAELARDIPGLRLLGPEDALKRVPVLRREGVGGAIDDPECRDLDVAAIHHGYLRQLRRRGGRLLTAAPITAIEAQGGGWRVATPAATILAERIVNAAGAWGDEIARLAGLQPIGLTPMRRTVILFKPETAPVDETWPLVFDLDESFYFKPETGRVLASPADETPTAPCDVQPEDWDVALTVERLQRATVFDVPRLERRWAGLRSFAPDRAPVVGPDPVHSGFIWCVGQGGYGIQTAPAMGRMTAALAIGESLSQELITHGVDAAAYSPARFASASAMP